MIEKLKIIEDDEIDMSIGAVNTRFEDTELVRKINEVIDAVNNLQTSNAHIQKDLCEMRHPEVKAAENVQEDTESRSENVQKPISLLDIHNEIGEMYSVLWNKIEDIRCELVHLQEEINPAEIITKGVEYE